MGRLLPCLVLIFCTLILHGTFAQFGRMFSQNFHILSLGVLHFYAPHFNPTLIVISQLQYHSSMLLSTRVPFPTTPEYNFRRPLPSRLP
jgi:hypothetical protein